jgi:hypothetical protein
MTKTKIKKVLAAISLIALASMNFSGTVNAATQIGTGSVSGTSSFDSAIMWDDNFPGSATGSVSGIVVTANVQPTLSLVVSTGAIDL